MIRAVLDTNVLLSALWSRTGASFEIVTRLRQGEFRLLLSNTLLSEYEEVLNRESGRLGITHATIERFLDAICALAEPFETSASWKPSLPDPDDEAVAQLAIEAKVGHLVTFNVRDFPQDRLPALQVIEPGKFLRILQTIKP